MIILNKIYKIIKKWCFKRCNNISIYIEKNQTYFIYEFYFSNGLEKIKIEFPFLKPIQYVKDILNLQNIEFTRYDLSEEQITLILLDKDKRMKQKYKKSRDRRNILINNTEKTEHHYIKKFIDSQNFCCYCNKQFSILNKKTLDHILPLAKGGTHLLHNFQALCLNCNIKKGDDNQDFELVYPHSI